MSQLNYSPPCVIIPLGVCHSAFEIVAVIRLSSLGTGGQEMEGNQKISTHVACVDALFVIEYNTARPSIISPVLNEFVALSRAQASFKPAEIPLWTRF